MTWGRARKHYEKLIELGRPVPAGYLDQPEIIPEFEFFWDAFWELSTEREVGMAPGQIPGSAIEGFCDRRGMNVDDLDQFRAVIRSLDSDYLFHQSNRPSDNDNIVDFAPIDDAAGVSAILKRLGKKPST